MFEREGKTKSSAGFASAPRVVGRELSREELAEINADRVAREAKEKQERPYKNAADTAAYCFGSLWNTASNKMREAQQEQAQRALNVLRQALPEKADQQKALSLLLEKLSNNSVAKKNVQAEAVTRGLLEAVAEEKKPEAVAAKPVVVLPAKKIPERAKRTATELALEMVSLCNANAVAAANDVLNSAKADKPLVLQELRSKHPGVWLNYFARWHKEDLELADKQQEQIAAAQEAKQNEAKEAQTQAKGKDGLPWENKVFAASIFADGEQRKLTFLLNRKDQENTVQGTFTLSGVGAGNITSGVLTSGKHELNLTCVYTRDLHNGKYVGQERNLAGRFWFVNDTEKKHVDANNDGIHDVTGEHLPLLLGGVWLNPKTGVKYELEPIPFGTNATETKTTNATQAGAKGNGLDWWQASIAKEGMPKSFTAEVANCVLWAANELGVNPNDLAACIAFESGDSFAPDKRNAGGGGAVGLVQFTKNGIDGMQEYLRNRENTDKRRNEILAYAWDVRKLDREALMAMAVTEQIRYVVLYFKANKLQPGASLAQIYKTILAPYADENSLYDKKKSPDAYAVNSNLDLDKDGIITAEEAVGKITNNGHVRDYFTKNNNQGVFIVKTRQSNKFISVTKDQLPDTGVFPVDKDQIEWQPTSLVSTETINALAEVRETTTKDLERDASQTATEFLATKRDYGNLTTGKDGIYQVHSGWDINAKADEQGKQPGYCALAGVVVHAGIAGEFGNTVIVYHPQKKLHTRYGHLKSISVKEGDVVRAHQQLGIIGNTSGGATFGPHLHFDVIKDLENIGMWNGNGDYDKDGDKDDLQDRIEYVKTRYEDPQKFFADTGVEIPKKPSRR